jgi:omega-6 fatty acid desaturase (delta-12 desaturase)
MTITQLTDPTGAAGAAPRWKAIVARFQRPSRAKASWQLINTLVPYVLLWVAMAYALTVSYWLVAPVALLAAGFLARIFIIFHDCGHGSFF